MLLPRNPLRLLHQQRAKPLMLKLPRVPRVHRHRHAIHMQLPHQTRRLAGQLLAKRILLGTLAQPQQRDQDILLGVLIREERLPPAVGGIVPPDQLDLVRPDLVLDLVDAHLTGAHIATGRSKVLHAREGQLAQVAVLDARRDQRHGDVALDAVDAGPGGHEGEDARDKVDEAVGGVVLVAARAPELVEARAADDEGRVDFEPVGAEGGRLEILAELV